MTTGAVPHEPRHSQVESDQRPSAVVCPGAMPRRSDRCSMNGCERLLGHLVQKLGIGPGETTADGRYTLSTVECLGSCGTAPVVMVNETYHENMNGEKLDELVAALV
jgi:NADH:ubiquinone oxidoreductase subunit E